MAVEGFTHRYYLIRTDTYAGVQNSEQVIDTLRFQDARRTTTTGWLASTRFPTYVDQNIALMRDGMRGNVLLPKVIVRRVLDQVVRLADAAAAEQRLLQAVRASAVPTSPTPNDAA